MKISLTVITGGVGGDGTDLNPTLSVEAQLIIDSKPVEVEVVVVPPVEEPVSEVVQNTIPEVVETTPNTVPEPTAPVEPEVIFVEPEPVEPPIFVEPPVVVVPPPPEVERTIEELPTLTINNPQLHVSFAGRANDSNYSETNGDTDFNFKWETFNAKTSEILNGKWQVTVPANEVKKGIHAVSYVAEKGEYFFGYEIEFDNNYDFTSLGGKLPGLIGLNTSLRKSNGNQVYPDGCNAEGQRRDEGFSLRSMFREGGRMIGYFYHEGNPNSSWCGHEVNYMHNGSQFYVKKGTKYYIETRCKMNSKYASNGIVQIWVNGFLVVSMTNMVLSHTLLYNINALFIYFWHGGNDSNWEPDNDSTVRFDNFVLQTTPISH